MNLSHYSEHAEVEPYDVAQDNHFRYDKPKGLWVSVDGEDDWPSWCASEEYAISPYRHRVTLAEGARVLRLTTPEEVEAFDEEYRLVMFESSYGVTYRIDWERVARAYQGIIIAPYQWNLRLGGPGWYYTWDCASGCIWEAAAIASVRALQPTAE